MKRDSIFGLRCSIEVQTDRWFPVYRFEGVYEITIDGRIRKFSNQVELNIHHGRKYDMVTLHHPNGDGSMMLVNLIDVWLATFCGNHDALNQYSYMESIK